MSKEIRLGVVGGCRGKGFGLSLESLKGTMKLTAICDLHQGVCESWKKDFPEIEMFTDYTEMLNSGIVDAVLIATPMPCHVPQSIEALEKDIHVACEVTACITIKEGQQLIKAVEKSAASYFFAENYVYMRDLMMVENMAQQGVFGEITYINGAYYHDCRALMFNDDGSLTWRGILRRDYNCHIYPTHTLGPIDRWLGVRKGKDRFISVSAHASKEAALSAYAAEKFGSDSKYANPDYFQHGDTIKTILKTENGVLIDMLFDPVSPRVGNCAEHFITGTKASFISDTTIKLPDGLRSGAAIAFAKDINNHNYNWEALADYHDKYEHDYWKENSEKASKAGHGGGDYFILRDFARTINGECEPVIDVYDGVLWSSLIELTAKSIANNGAAVDIPNFRP